MADIEMPSIHLDEEVIPDDDVSIGSLSSAKKPTSTTTLSERIFNVFLCLATIKFIIVLVMLAGKEYEQSQIRILTGSGTKYLYETSQVCAMEINKKNHTLEFQTLEDASAVDQLDGEAIVAHCGECGQCSNPVDINYYDKSAGTLYMDTLRCAKKAVLGREAVETCMSDAVGLTSPCRDCWVSNIMCTMQSCVFTCLIHAFMNGNIHSGSSHETLNLCTQCDEVRCGPAFLECAGANRRRSGIITDIVRDDDEVCKVVEPGWWKDESLQVLWLRDHESK